jgi:hypothetical protein
MHRYLITLALLLAACNPHQTAPQQKACQPNDIDVCLGHQRCVGEKQCVDGEWSACVCDTPMAGGPAPIAGSPAPRAGSPAPVAGKGGSIAPPPQGGTGGSSNPGCDLPLGSACATNEDCCPNVGCVQGVCIDACTHGSDCLNGCCYAGATYQVCAPTLLCENPTPPVAGNPAPPMCETHGSSCETNQDCCGSVCIQNVCTDKCQSDADCLSGCCAPGYNLCAPKTTCTYLPPPDPTCELPAGTECVGDSDCCTGAYCLAAVCSDSCTSNAECVSGCCHHGLCAHSVNCAPPIPVPTTCLQPTLVGDDGTYLGVCSSNQFATDGVCNTFSSYGGQFGTYSIYNEFGTYGSQFSALSAYNQFTSTPPRVMCESGSIIGVVSKNTFLVGAIDPDVLCATLRANGY